MDNQVPEDHPEMMANPDHQGPTDKAVAPVAKGLLVHPVTPDPQVPLDPQETKATMANPAHPDLPALQDLSPRPDPMAAQATQEHQDPQDHPERMLNTALARHDLASELPRWPLRTLDNKILHGPFLFQLLICSSVFKFSGLSKFA